MGNLQLQGSKSRTCAYCGSGGPLTHEHLFTDGLLKRVTPPENALQYLKKPRKFVDGDVTVKDVCSKCNNELLSSLDDYICKLYDECFKDFVHKGESIRFRYDFDKLARWLLKTIYNSGRVHNYGSHVFPKWIQYILYGLEKPEGITILVRIVIPHKVDSAAAYAKRLSEAIQKAGERVPAQVRIIEDANPSLLRYEKIFALYRIVALNSYYFHVIIPNLYPYSRPEWRRTLRQIQREDIREAHRLTLGHKDIFLSASHFDFWDVSRYQVEANLDLYSSEFGNHESSSDKT